MSMSKNTKGYCVTRKSDGKKVFVSENFYNRVVFSQALAEISVNNIEEDMTDKVIYRDEVATK